MDTARENITREVGSRIRYARKSRGMSMDELAQAIYKTRSAISKYENGQISVDIATLYDIANALKVSIYDLLYRNTPDIDQEYNAEVPAFFREVSQLYMYFFDGRVNRAQCTVIDIFPTEESSTAEVLMYMNIKDLAHYRVCESTYHGTMTHYEAFSAMLFQNDDMPMDKYQIGRRNCICFGSRPRAACRSFAEPKAVFRPPRRSRSRASRQRRSPPLRALRQPWECADNAACRYARSPAPRP